ncbi:N-acetylneuraminate synthase [Clostridium botulinum]|uniref:N-acetylneuraminate synthase family protein n=1 Tax=Clostridium botulinum TaxID=1491 RepID=UPI0006A6C495|nr:N-acetylneuraminate synthase family protein [Clostridium botulinum]KOM96826.1 N-acetylneuraminate synthase [Clostridium botulinum]KOM99243.1 N-acetylneuraminate synthase [Clostridium botulinum]MBY7004819.1 N-acetylneuraminate synthase family protein [Clostridium botulinum]MCR1147486.1 N-acetylneuraminate synthase family protein [Clostridium botulinum]NFH94237.1 N-acetylneuraminate synthase [Clostridium botulinum]
MKDFYIGKKKVGEKSSIFIIAEIGVNHNGNIDLAYKLIDLASKAGADAVKFQMFYPEKLCSEIYRKDEIEMLKKYVLSFENMKKLRDYTYSLGLEFIVTPFDFKSLDDIINLDCSAIKVASGELTHIPFIKKAASYNKPLIISTGASNLSDVERAVIAIKSVTDEKISILHCVSTYPSPDECLNLRALKTLEVAFNDCIIGFSDHSLGYTASNLAVALGASIIEKHITLDKNLKGPDHKASASQGEFVNMVYDIRKAEKMLGDGYKKPQACEEIIGRSIVAARDLEAGEVLRKEDIDYKRPGWGVRPYDENKIIGAHLQKSIKKDDILQLDYFMRKIGDQNGR